MKEYSFYIDRKGTIWERTDFTIEANSIEEANTKALEYIQGTEDSNDEIEYLSETFEYITPEQNEGCPTEQLFTGKGETLFENGSQLTYEKLIKN